MGGDENYEELLQVDAFKFMCTMRSLLDSITATNTNYFIMEIIKRELCEYSHCKKRMGSVVVINFRCRSFVA